MSDIDNVRAWILKRNTDVEWIESTDDLIDNRYIDSLAFVEFLLYLEELGGEEIPLESVDIEDFRTLDAIARRYLNSAVTTSVP